MKKQQHKVVRVQGSDADLVAAMDREAKGNWKLLQTIPTGRDASANPAADGQWLLVFVKDN